jgi:acylphosphatase
MRRKGTSDENIRSITSPCCRQYRSVAGKRTSFSLPAWVLAVVLLSAASLHLVVPLASIQSAGSSPDKVTADGVVMRQAPSEHPPRNDATMDLEPRPAAPRPLSLGRRSAGNQGMGTWTSSTYDGDSRGAGGFRFEVHGKVQGVSFRKYAQRKAREIVQTANKNGGGQQAFQLVGWIRNTGRGTVEGEVASSGSQQQPRLEFQNWLQMTGSPKSRIDKADFVDLDPERVQTLLRRMDDFEIRKTTTE